MKKIIDKDKVIFIALIYNYIANNKTSLSVNLIQNFIETINQNLDILESEWKIDLNSDIQTQYFYGMHKDIDKQEYKLNYTDLKGIQFWYDCQPYEVINASLKENALETINVKKEDIEIKKEDIKKYSTLEIYSSETISTQEYSKKHLENEGNKNIHIGLEFSKQLKQDKGYSITSECDKVYERANILTKKK